MTTWRLWYPTVRKAFYLRNHRRAIYLNKRLEISFLLLTIGHTWFFLRLILRTFPSSLLDYWLLHRWFFRFQPWCFQLIEFCDWFISIPQRFLPLNTSNGHCCISILHLCTKKELWRCIYGWNKNKLLYGYWYTWCLAWCLRFLTLTTEIQFTIQMMFAGQLANELGST